MSKCSTNTKAGLADKKGLFVTVALLVKGSVTDKAKLYVLIGSGGENQIRTDQLHHTTCSLVSAALHSKQLNPRAVIWGGEDAESNSRLARVFLDDATFNPELSGTSVSILPSTHPSICPSQSINLAIHPSVHPLICLSINLSIYPVILLSVHSCFHPCTCPFPYASINLPTH